MTTRVLKNPPVAAAAVERFKPDRMLKDYAVLKERVKEVLIVGRRRIEREFMLMRYKTGLLINEHVRLNNGHGVYGARAVRKLGEAFDLDYTELTRYAQFARAYPIVGGRQLLAFNLPWTHYRKLMTIPDEKLRGKLTREAEKNEWRFEDVEARVRRAFPIGKKNRKIERLPPVSLGPFFTYKIIGLTHIHTASTTLMLDLGFKHRVEMNTFDRPARFTEGMFVTAGEDSFSLTEAKDATDEMRYTYKARVEEVIDGDTLKIDFSLGLGSHKGEKIRLNHIDCPELAAPEGKAAKRFVEKELSGVKFITVKSVRTQKEKWGRYLGEVFYRRDGKDPLIYLNQLLLDEGHAVRL